MCTHSHVSHAKHCIHVCGWTCSIVAFATMISLLVMRIVLSATIVIDVLL